jgi:hypothetical protein
MTLSTSDSVLYVLMPRRTTPSMILGPGIFLVKALSILGEVWSMLCSIFSHNRYSSIKIIGGFAMIDPGVVTLITKTTLPSGKFQAGDWHLVKALIFLRKCTSAEILSSLLPANRGDSPRRDRSFTP